MAMQGNVVSERNTCPHVRGMWRDRAVGDRSPHFQEGGRGCDTSRREHLFYCATAPTCLASHIAQLKVCAKMKFKNPKKQVWEKPKPCPNEYWKRYQKLLEDRKNTKSQDLFFSWIMTKHGVEMRYTEPTPDQLPLNKNKSNHGHNWRTN